MIVAGLLILGAIGAAILGALLLSQATLGVGLIALACFAGIVARIVQAQVLSRTPAPPTQHV
jgi:hypothetical protein